MHDVLLLQTNGSFEDLTQKQQSVRTRPRGRRRALWLCFRPEAGAGLWCCGFRPRSRRQPFGLRIEVPGTAPASLASALGHSSGAGLSGCGLGFRTWGSAGLSGCGFVFRPSAGSGLSGRASGPGAGASLSGLGFRLRGRCQPVWL